MCALASFPGSPGTRIFIHACTTSMFAFRSVGAWERGYVRAPRCTTFLVFCSQYTTWNLTVTMSATVKMHVAFLNSANERGAKVS